MKGTRALAALLAGVGLTAAGSAAAAIPSGNLIVNGDAEQGAAASNSSEVMSPPSWTVSSGFTQVAYGTPEFPTTPDSQTIGGGNAFFAGGPSSPTSTADQSVDVSGAAAEIDADGVSARLSGYLGGWSTQVDQAKVDATFLAANQAPLGTLTIGPVTEAQRGGVTTLLPTSGTAAVPAGTRAIAVRITATPTEGAYNDGYADNLSLTLLPRTDKMLADLPKPVLGKQVNVAAVSGKVLVAVPARGAGGGAARASQKGLRFVALKSARQIPTGSFLNARKGTVRLQSAANSAGKRQSGDYSKGLFQVLQSRKKKAKGLTDLVLKGGKFTGCGGAKRARAALSRRAIRRLRASARGRFRTRGRYSAATVRGTKWTVTDRCDNTLTKVTRGKVAVRDFRRKKTILVKTGKSYLARPGRLP